MVTAQLIETVLALPEGDRLDLAHRLVESVSAERELKHLIADGVRRIEDVLEGRVVGLTEEQFRQALV